MAPPKFNFRFIIMTVFFFGHFLPSINHQVYCSAAVLAPVKQDPSTRRYILSLYLKTPLQPTNLLLDLCSPLSWVDSATVNNASSATFHPISCGSPLCNSLTSPRQLAACATNDSCRLFLSTPRHGRGGGVTVRALVDKLALPATDGRNPGQKLRVIPEFVLSCSERSSLRGLVPRGVTGLAALSRSNFSLPAQVSEALASPRVFALCLSGSPSAPGVAFFGTPGPYYFFPQGTDLSKHLTYTPLLSDQDDYARRHHPWYSSSNNVNDYFVGLTSIKVNGRVVVAPQQLASRSRIKLSVGAPYTRLESSIYAVLMEAFVNESAALHQLTPTTQPVRPFSVCYDAADMVDTITGPAVPTIDLVMHDDDDSNEKLWRIFGSNSMVRMPRRGEGMVDVWCLAFVDGGQNPGESSSVVMGGHQMADNMLQFDLESHRLGYSSSVLLYNTMCANFNFTVNNNISI